MKSRSKVINILLFSQNDVKMLRTWFYFNYIYLFKPASQFGWESLCKDIYNFICYLLRKYKKRNCCKSKVKYTLYPFEKQYNNNDVKHHNSFYCKIYFVFYFYFRQSNLYYCHDLYLLHNLKNKTDNVIFSIVSLFVIIFVCNIDFLVLIFFF